MNALRERRVRPSTRTITFSWRLHESSVQFVEPDQTSVPSRTTNLWCIRSGTPGDRARRHRQRLDRLGPRLGRRRHGDRPGVVDVVDEPDRDPALLRREERREDERAGVGLEADVVDGDVEARPSRLRGTSRARARSRSGSGRRPSASAARSASLRRSLRAARAMRRLAGALGRLVVGRAPPGESTSPRPRAAARTPPSPAGVTPRRFASTPTSVRAFISPIPGSAEQALLEVGAVARAGPDRGRVAAVLARDRGAVLLHAACHVGGEAVQRGLLPEDASSSRRGSIAAIVGASSPPSRFESSSGDENAFCTVTCWSSTKPIISASGLSPRNASASGSPREVDRRRRRRTWILSRPSPASRDRVAELPRVR